MNNKTFQNSAKFVQKLRIFSEEPILLLIRIKSNNKKKKK